MEYKINMKNSTNISLYTKVLAIRASFKQLQQISWQVNNLEKKYPLEILSENELAELHSTYTQFIPELELLLEKLKMENGRNTNNTTER